MKRNKTPQDMILKLKDPLEIFDLTCAANYFAGNFNQPIPVDNSRQAFERIKYLLGHYTEKGKEKTLRICRKGPSKI